MVPYILIGIVALIGLLAGGFAGLVAGGVIGFVLTLAIGTIVNWSRGGSLPRKVRRALVVNLLTNHPQVVEAALPNSHGDLLYQELERAVERVVQRAIVLSPTPDDRVTHSVPMLMAAVASLSQEERNPSMITLYQCIGARLVLDWY
jgi:hypothetical protein